MSLLSGNKPITPGIYVGGAREGICVGGWKATWVTVTKVDSTGKATTHEGYAYGHGATSAEEAAADGVNKATGHPNSSTPYN